MSHDVILDTTANLVDSFDTEAEARAALEQLRCKTRTPRTSTHAVRADQMRTARWSATRSPPLTSSTPSSLPADKVAVSERA